MLGKLAGKAIPNWPGTSDLLRSVCGNVTTWNDVVIWRVIATQIDKQIDVCRGNEFFEIGVHEPKAFWRVVCLYLDRPRLLIGLVSYEHISPSSAPLAFLDVIDAMRPL
jgi:hypothetical protein